MWAKSVSIYPVLPVLLTLKFLFGHFLCLFAAQYFSTFKKIGSPNDRFARPQRCQTQTSLKWSAVKIFRADIFWASGVVLG